MIEMGNRMVRKVIPVFGTDKRGKPGMFQRATIDLPRQFSIGTFQKAGAVDPLEQRKANWDPKQGLSAWSILIPTVDDPSVLFMKIFLSEGKTQDSVMADANEAQSQLFEKLAQKIVAKQVITKQGTSLSKEIKGDIQGILTDLTKSVDLISKLKKSIVETLVQKVSSLLTSEDFDKLTSEFQTLISISVDVETMSKDNKLKVENLVKKITE